MTTSGSIDFSLTAREVVTFALRKINVCATTEDPTADDSARAMQELNLMLKGWQKYPSLWRLTEGSITMISATASYTLSPFPHRVTSIRYRTGTVDTPLTWMTRGEYFDLATRTTAGAPTQYYIDFQRSAATLYVYPVLTTVSAQTFLTTFQRKFEDIDDLANDIDVRQEWLEVVGYNLAVRIAPDFGASSTARFPVIKAMADGLLADALYDDREDRAHLTQPQGKAA
jgi:hypothetical protein